MAVTVMVWSMKVRPATAIALIFVKTATRVRLMFKQGTLRNAMLTVHIPVSQLAKAMMVVARVAAIPPRIMTARIHVATIPLK